MHSSVQWALLGLVIERPSYGYELAHRFERIYGGVLDLSAPSYVYTALKALQRRQLVEEFEGGGSGRQPKPGYRASSAGVQAYKEHLVSQMREDRRRSRLLLCEVAVLARQPELALDVIDACEQACLEDDNDASLFGVLDRQKGGALGLAERLLAEEGRVSRQARLPWIEYARREFEALMAGSQSHEPA